MLIDVSQERQLTIENAFSQEGVEIRKSHAVGSFYGGCAAEKGHILQMPHPFKAFVVSYQKLPSPDGAIAAISRAIEGNPNNRLLNLILHHAAHNMGVVVLHRNESELVCPLFCILCGEIFGVQVISQNLGLDAEKL